MQELRRKGDPGQEPVIVVFAVTEPESDDCRHHALKKRRDHAGSGGDPLRKDQVSVDRGDHCGHHPRKRPSQKPGGQDSYDSGIRQRALYLYPDPVRDNAESPEDQPCDQLPLPDPSFLCLLCSSAIVKQDLPEKRNLCQQKRQQKKQCDIRCDIRYDQIKHISTSDSHRRNTCRDCRIPQQSHSPVSHGRAGLTQLPFRRYSFSRTSSAIQ